MGEVFKVVFLSEYILLVIEMNFYYNMDYNLND